MKGNKWNLPARIEALEAKIALYDTQFEAIRHYIADLETQLKPYRTLTKDTTYQSVFDKWPLNGVANGRP